MLYKPLPALGIRSLSCWKPILVLTLQGLIRNINEGALDYMLGICLRWSALCQAASCCKKFVLKIDLLQYHCLHFIGP